MGEKKPDHRNCHGGNLRKVRAGRRRRPLHKKAPVHLVFKANREVIGGGFRVPRRFRVVNSVFKKYARRFSVRIQEVSFQFDHIHVVARHSRRSDFQNFLRVFSGQTVQKLSSEGILVTDTSSKNQMNDAPKKRFWLRRPYTRIVWGVKALRVALAYVRLNELEAQGKIPYRKGRLRDLEREERIAIEKWVTDTHWADVGRA